MHNKSALDQYFIKEDERISAALAQIDSTPSKKDSIANLSAAKNFDKFATSPETLANISSKHFNSLPQNSLTRNDVSEVYIFFVLLQKYIYFLIF